MNPAMIQPKPAILEEIFAHKKREVQRHQAKMPLEMLIEQARAMPPVPDFCHALQNTKNNHRSPALIAEIKYASPVKGKFNLTLTPLELAKLYVENGAAAVSVLTDEAYFHGHLDNLRQISSHFPEVPTLCKDFIFDPYQIYEARVAGASAILLIASMLSERELNTLQQLCQDLGLTALIEVHNVIELDKALHCNPRIIGINNRNLHDFSVNLETCLQLRPLIAPDIMTVAESGIKSAKEVKQLAQAGFDAILVGEALVTDANIGGKVQELARVRRSEHK